ncbi:hypothetical protein [Marinicella sp. W31]|uniref:hypothetical protein n=1 Tax=Marinicella sp. W31 TaxID=3023713 RepID=UPI0037563BAD
MKKLITLLSLTCALFISQASAVTLGYSGYVVFSDGTSFSPFGTTQEICEANLRSIVDAYLASNPHVEVLNDRSLPCGRRTEDISDIGFVGNLLPEIPKCLTCPLLGPETFDTLYPDLYSEVKELYYQYKIDRYNQELLELQSHYNFRDFQKELYNLQNKKQ